jgi:hypothetical protein
MIAAIQKAPRQQPLTNLPRPAVEGKPCSITNNVISAYGLQDTVLAAAAANHVCHTGKR